jgi:hypothetical protein
MNIYVETYSGYKADEYPIRFTLSNKSFDIISIEDRWYSPEKAYFKIFSDDGNTYILSHSFETDKWEINLVKE